MAEIVLEGADCSILEKARVSTIRRARTRGTTKNFPFKRQYCYISRSVVFQPKTD